MASLNLLAMEHTARILFQEKTRSELGGPFFRDYIHSIRVPKTWEDGDEWYINYIGHPLHGAAAGRAWLIHHPHQLLDISMSKAYWSSRAKAAEWAAFYSLQFEFGPLSEASIGNVGKNPRTVGWVDHAVTPVGAFGLIVAEDVLDKYLVQFIERHTTNRAYRAIIRVLFNPSRAMANFADGRLPWFRPLRPLDIRYDK